MGLVVTRYLLDTNVISELQRKRPHQSVATFFAATNAADHYLSVLTIGELRKGAIIRRNRGEPAGDEIDLWVDRVLTEMIDRVLLVDMSVTSVWARFASDRSRRVVDTLLAATAFVHSMVLVTRNVRDYKGLPVEILNPWDAKSPN